MCGFKMVQASALTLGINMDQHLSVSRSPIVRHHTTHSLLTYLLYILLTNKIACMYLQIIDFMEYALPSQHHLSFIEHTCLSLSGQIRLGNRYICPETHVPAYLISIAVRAY